MADWRATTALTTPEKMVCELAEALTHTPADVSADLRARLEVEFSPKQLVELAHTIAWENARARFNRTFGVEPDGYVQS